MTIWDGIQFNFRQEILVYIISHYWSYSRPNANEICGAITVISFARTLGHYLMIRLIRHWLCSRCRSTWRMAVKLYSRKHMFSELIFCIFRYNQMLTLLLKSTACFLWQNVFRCYFKTNPIQSYKKWPKIYSVSTKSQVFIATTNMRL